MPMNSVNTNYGAAVALQSLNKTASELSATERRISTGMKVATAKDNGAIFAIAQRQRATVAGLDSVKDSLDRGQSIVDVALAAGSTISGLLTEMKEKALSAADGSLNTAARTALANDFNSLRDQITRSVTNASFDGKNLISTGATALTSLANTDISKVTVAAQSLTLVGLGLTAATTFTTAATASTAAGLIDTAITTSSARLANLGTGANALERQNTFITKLQDSLVAGIGNLVDADLAKESAKLQALQTKQQLGIQALSIANQSSSTVLSLFR
jgi:flagellin